MKITPILWHKAAAALGVLTYGDTSTEIANKAIEIAIAEASVPEATEIYITAEQAQALGPGNAEYRVNRISTGYLGAWRLCLEGCFYDPSDALWEVQYRAIKQPELVDPHAELKALYEQQVKNTDAGVPGGLNDFVWEFYANNLSRSAWVPENPPSENWMNQPLKWRCTAKPTCQVKNLDTGVTETMTREKAKLLQAETKDVCDWFYPSGFFDNKPFDFTCTGRDTYTYRPKANLVKLDGVLMTREAAIAKYEAVKDTNNILWKSINMPCWSISGIGTTNFPSSHESCEYQLCAKPVAKKLVLWADMPVDIAVQSKVDTIKRLWKLHGISRDGVPALSNLNSETCDFFYYQLNHIELAPANQQPWLNWRSGECPVPEGVVVEITCRDCSIVKRIAKHCVWGHEEEGYDIIAYRVVGLIDNTWEMV